MTKVCIGLRNGFIAVAETAFTVEGNIAVVERARQPRRRRGRRQDYGNARIIGTREALAISPNWSSEAAEAEENERVRSRVVRKTVVRLRQRRVIGNLSAIPK